MSDKELQKEEESDEDNSTKKQNNNSSSNGVRIWKLSNDYLEGIEFDIFDVFDVLKEAVKELNQNYSSQFKKENNKENCFWFF